MIGYIQGTVLAQNKNKVILKTLQNIGYEITINKSFPSQSEQELYISTIQKESSLDLYGFMDFEEKILFEKLIGGKGVGPKVAINLLTTFHYQELIKLIVAGDHKKILTTPGVGSKLAKQIILEFQDKFEKSQNLSSKSSQQLPAHYEKINDINLALQGLGLTEQAGQQCLDDFLSSEENKKLLEEHTATQIVQKLLNSQSLRKNL